jgi:hypothetical protein
MANDGGNGANGAHVLLCLIGAVVFEDQRLLPENKEVLPDHLRHYLAEVLRRGGRPPRPPRRKRGRKRENQRDFSIVGSIGWLMHSQGLKPTRNPAARNKEGSPDSACSAVARSFGLTEDAVEQIWRRNKHFRKFL